MIGILLGIISLFIFSLRLNSFPLKNWDEAWYAEIIKNLASGHYSFLVPFWNGQYYFDKPPLYFWLTYPVVKIFGVGEWQVRLVSVVAAALAVVFVYKIATKLFSKRVGLFSGVIYLSIGQVILRGQEGNLDSLLVLVFLVSFYFFLNSDKHRRNVFLSGLFLGAGYLVKSWLLGFLPILLMSTYVIFVKRKLFKHLISIFLISILVSMWWFILGAKEFGWEFIRWYLLSPGAGNYGSSISLNFGYFKSLFLDIGLWWLPLAFIIFRRKTFSLSKPNQRKVVAIIIPSVIFFLVLNISTEKFNWYLLPIYPFIAIVLGLIFSVFLAFGDHFIRPILIIALIGQIFTIYNFHQTDTDRSLVGVSLGLTLKDKIPAANIVVLDDTDFPAFLYYSNRKKILVTQPGGGKPREYWIINHQQLNNLLPTNKIWVVTPDIQHFSSFTFSNRGDLPNGYHLLVL